MPPHPPLSLVLALPTFNCETYKFEAGRLESLHFPAVTPCFFKKKTLCLCAPYTQITRPPPLRPSPLPPRPLPPWRMSARAALSPRSSPSLLVALLLLLLSFPAFAQLSNKRLSPSYFTVPLTCKLTRGGRGGGGGGGGGGQDFRVTGTVNSLSGGASRGIALRDGETDTPTPRRRRRRGRRRRRRRSFHANVCKLTRRSPNAVARRRRKPRLDGTTTQAAQCLHSRRARWLVKVTGGPAPLLLLLCLLLAS